MPTLFFHIAKSLLHCTYYYSFTYYTDNNYIVGLNAYSTVHTNDAKCIKRSKQFCDRIIREN